MDDVEYNFSPEQLKRMPKEDADVAKTAAMEDILGPEEGGEGGEAASADNSLLAEAADGGSGNNTNQSGPNYAFVVSKGSGASRRQQKKILIQFFFAY